MSARLRVDDVSVRIAGADILQHVTFGLHRGELCAVLGPSGAGKSTLIKVLLGLRRPSQGQARLGEEAPAAAGPVGYVPQDDALHTTLTVDKELFYAAELRLADRAPARRTERVEQVLAAVGLEERRQVRIGSLSGGQRKRVSVALELLTRPELLILDEPTSGLDPGLEAKSMDLFAEVASSGRIVVVATHAMESLRKCQALLLLVAGRVAYFGPPAEAPAYFGVDRFASIFPRLQERAPVVWARQWIQAPLRRQFAARPAPAAREAA